MDRSVWLSRRALKLHAVILIVVPGFLALCIWQITRALGGNTLSWAYVFEWPLFAAYAVYMWWRLVHESSVDASVDSGAGGTVEPPPGATKGSGGVTAATGAAARPGASVPSSDHLGDAAQRHLQAEGKAEEEQEKEDAELAAYNDYLAQLAEQDNAAGR